MSTNHLITLPSASVRSFATAFLLVLAQVSQGAIAGEELLSETDINSDIRWTKSATRLRQHANNTPAAVTVIDRAMIEASGAVNIADLLRLVPGFQVYHVNANVFGVVSHGQGEVHNGRLEVMVDGRSVYLPMLSTVDWSALGIGLDDIERIEVVRGPNVQTQGSNAFLGAVNILTRDPVSSKGTSLQATGGSLKTRDYHVSHYGSIGSVDFRFSANYHHNNGTGQGRDDANQANPLQKIEDGGEISQILGRALYSPTLADTYEFQFGVGQGKIGIGSATSLDSYDPRYLNSNFQSFSWVRNLDHDSTVRVVASHTYHKFRETDLLFVPAGFGGLGLPDFTIDLGIEDGINRRYDLEAEFTFKPANEMRAVIGFGSRRESVESQALLGTPRDITENLYRTFGNLEWKSSPSWVFNFGLIAEHNDLVEPRLSARVGLNYHLDVLQTLRGAASRSYRTPSLLEERQFTAITLPDGRVFDVNAYTAGSLESEKVTNYEVGYRLQNTRFASDLDIRLFLEEIEDAINGVAVQNGPFISFDNQNVAYWSNRGVEVQWSVQPQINTWMYLAYAYVESWGEQPRGIGRRIEQPEDHNPRHTLAVVAAHRPSVGLEVSLAYYAMSSVEWLQGSTLESYDRLDMRISKSAKFGRSRAKAEVIVQNLLSSYTEFEDNNIFDTRAFLRLSLSIL